MQVKFLKSIVEHLINKQATPIVDLLLEKKDVNEFLIAKKLDLTINQIRNILYKLSDYGLVSFIRKKDKRKGWYIYFWTLNVHQSLILLEDKLKKELEQLEYQLKSRREKRFYTCKTCSIEVSEEVALLNDFACSECEEVYELNQNAVIIQQLEKDIINIQKEIKLVSEEKKEEEDKLEKKKAKKIKKSEDDKKSQRAAKRKESAKTRESAKAKAKDSLKKSEKKPSKKVKEKNSKLTKSKKKSK